MMHALTVLVAILAGLLIGASIIVGGLYLRDQRFRHVALLACSISMLCGMAAVRVLGGVKFAPFELAVLLIAMGLGNYGILWILNQKLRGAGARA